jgi:CRP/FNR family transcriptional regulator
MDLAYFLRRCKLFADLSPRELDALRQISQRRELAKGQTVFREGDTSRGFCVVVGGAVKIYRTGADGRERILHVVEAGESFAEAALFMETYPATAEALDPTTVICIQKNGFKQLLVRDTRLNFKIIASLVRWLRELRDALTDLTLKEVPARFASYVLSLPANPGEPVNISISKTTGTTKETFSRLLRRLAEHRILTYRGNQIRILNRARLERIAAGDEKI